MSIGEICTYVALCEGCDEAPDDTGYPTREAAYQSAVDANWVEVGDDLILCPRCSQGMSEPDPWQLDMFPGIAP